VPGDLKKFVVTSVVMRHFFSLPGAPRACTDFCDPTAVSRLKKAVPIVSLLTWLWAGKDRQGDGRGLMWANLNGWNLHFSSVLRPQFSNPLGDYFCSTIKYFDLVTLTSSQHVKIFFQHSKINEASRILA